MLAGQSGLFVKVRGGLSSPHFLAQRAFSAISSNHGGIESGMPGDWI